MNQKKQIIITIITIVAIFLVMIGLTYAYFTANITGGEETTTITVTGGSMNITYNGGSAINIENILPDDEPFTIKNFTVTGNNTTDIEMYYEINLIVESNTFSEEALKYKLLSTNTNNNGGIVSSITELTNIGTGSKTIPLGVGNFDVPTNGDKVHTYNLEIYFPNADYNQNIEQEKVIKAHIEIKNYIAPILGEAILNQDGGASVIEAKSTPAYNVINGTSGLYATEDEYGTSYYYRGLKTELNNNLIWAGFQWKIVRINGDGSVRLIYNGTEEQFNLNKTVNDTGLSTQISTAAWNTTNKDDAKYVGYMYGGANGTASTVRNGTTSSAATYNETNTNAKTQLDNWYQANIQNNGYSNIVVDNLFCNDRQSQREVGGGVTGPGYGVSETSYATYYRLYINKTPTLKCGLKNDRFTVSDISKGNRALTYPVGLITADEAAMAGLVFGTANSTNYLYTNQGYWVLSPLIMNSSGNAYVCNVFSSGAMTDNIYVNVGFGLRPSLSISPDISVTGNGNSTNPYKAT